jgi:hypothetical protein
MTRQRIVLLFVCGALLRAAGLLFNGMADLYQILLEWGANVAQLGVVNAFAINYGIFSYAFFGIAASLAELVPRFWWAPYKLIILGFDIGVLLALLRIARPEHRQLVFLMYWLNPWFVLHEAYLGFWEAPHILFGLLAVVAVLETPAEKWKWLVAGALLGCSAMFKPQGLVHFAGPLGLYLIVQALRGERSAVVWYAAGCGGVMAAVSLWIAAAGGPLTAVADNYRSVLADVGGVSNGSPGIWRFLVFLYMLATGQHQTIPFVKMPRWLIASASAVAALVTLGLQVFFAIKVRLPRTVAGRGWVVLGVLAFGSLVMSQFGVRAHINHSYGAMVLLVPFAASDRTLRTLWIAVCAMLGTSHLLVFGVGHGALLPPEHLFSRYPAAADLIARVTALPAYATPDSPLRVQISINEAIARLPGETIVSLLSIVVFGLVCLMVARILTVLRFDRP